jgi:ubiquinone/menaquinone biosynthesis C-methylase UbiE
MHYKALAWHCLSHYVDSFDGLRILEIGGSSKGESAIYFAQNGADVLVTNIAHGITNAAPIYTDKEANKLKHPICFDTADAHDLSRFYGQYNIVFGVSVLEHIPRPKLYLEECSKCLKSGGLMFLSGGPLWSCSYGHHLWTPRFSFTKRNPILPWEHLYRSSYDDLHKALVTRLDSEDEAAEICEWVFSSANINRIRTNALTKALEGGACRLRSLTCHRNSGKPTEDTLSKLKGYDYCELMTTGMSAILEK